MIHLDRPLLYDNRVMPADIDNFIIDSINYKEGKYLKIRGNFNRVPREIGNCRSLKNINLCSNQIVDISALYNLIYLEFLYLSNNKIVNISALSNLTSLKYLDLDDNKIVDISALPNLASLKYLYLRNNEVKYKIKFNPRILVIY